MLTHEETMEQGVVPDALSAALLANDGGIGCQYRLRAVGLLGAETLAALELVKPIRQRIPTCEEHGCPLLDGCRFARLFREGAAGRSGKKFRLTPLGDRARRDPAIRRQVADAALTLPLARRILAILAARGSQTIFTLNAALLDEHLAALAHDGSAGDAAFERGELADGLTLLGALGALGYDGYRVNPVSDATTTP
jgi:hypothetical protein